jgi:hypothetical protein
LLEVVTREEALQEARNWLQEKQYHDESHDELEKEFMQLWQGIFYFYWLTDKEAVQEVAAQNIASMLHLLEDENAIILFLKTFFETLHPTWIKLDKHRYC